MKNLHLAFAYLLIFSLSCATHTPQSKKSAVKELIDLSKQENGQMMTALDRQVSDQITKLKSQNSNPEIISTLTTMLNQFKEKMELNFNESIISQEKQLQEFSAKELDQIMTYTKRQSARTKEMMKIQDLPGKINLFFTQGEDEKIPAATMDLIRNHFVTSRQSEMINMSVKANEPYTREILTERKYPKDTIDKIIAQTQNEALIKNENAYIYLSNLEDENELKKDVKFFETPTYQRYISIFLTELKSKSGSAAKFMHDVTKQMLKVWEGKKIKKKKK